VIAREPVALDEVVRRTLATLAAADKMAELRVSVELQPVFVRGDETRLEQVVTNLLTNALRYTRAGGSVSISLMAIDRDAVLVVADSGIGIAQHVLPRVFELFVQGERGIERAQGGLGIGLTLVKRLVGCTAARWSPRATVKTKEAPSLSNCPCSRRRQRWRRRHGLTAERSSADASSWSRTIGRARCCAIRSRWRSRGLRPRRRRGGLAAALSLKPDAAIIDIGLPGLSGYELARRIRSVADGRMTLIALTGYGRTKTGSARCVRIRPAHRQPVEAEKLLEAVASKPTDTRLQA
jgi:CheY-like chemotaxis protein